MRGFWGIFDDRNLFCTDAQGLPYTQPRRLVLCLWGLGSWEMLLPERVRFALWNWMVGYPKGKGVKSRQKPNL